MSNTPTIPKYSPRLEALFEQRDPPKSRLIFAIDAIASRQSAWDMVDCRQTAKMLQAAAANAGLELQLIHYRGEREFTASQWMSDARALTAAMSCVICAAGSDRATIVAITIREILTDTDALEPDELQLRLEQYLRDELADIERQIAADRRDFS